MTQDGITDWFKFLTPQQKAWLPYFVLVTAVFVVYANVFRNAFLWEDIDLIVNNDALRHWNGLPALLGKTTLDLYYRPVQVLLYFLIYQIFGLSEAAFHGINVLLQALNACFMYQLGCRLGFYKRATFAAALLWGIHPLWIEVVAAATGTADLLMTSFIMTGLLALLPDFAPYKIWKAMIFFILALGCKESAVVFPALATFTLFLVSKERLHPATYFRTWPLWLLTTAYLIGWLMCPVLNNFASYVHEGSLYVENYEHNIVNRILTSLATLPVYLWLMVTPAKLHMNWNFFVFQTIWDWQVIAGAAIIAAALLQIVRGGQKHSLPLTWALLWFAAALSPYTGILKPIDGQLFEHWVYLPAIGLFLGASHAMTTWMDALHSKKARVVAASLMVLATLVLGVKTHVQNEILYNAGTLFESILKDNPTAAAYDDAAGFYFEQKEYEKAAEKWREMEALDNYRQYHCCPAILPRA